MIHTKLLLVLTLPMIFVVYSIFLSPPHIVNIIFEEQYLILVSFVIYCIFRYMVFITKDKLLYEFIPNLNHVSIKSTIGFFLLFQVIDFYFEDGFIGMISMWFMYWVFAVILYYLTHIINLYKNIQAYKKMDSFK